MNATWMHRSDFFPCFFEIFACILLKCVDQKRTWGFESTCREVAGAGVAPGTP